MTTTRFEVFYKKRNTLNYGSIYTFFNQVFITLFPLFFWFKDKNQFNNWINNRNLLSYSKNSSMRKRSLEQIEEIGEPGGHTLAPPQNRKKTFVRPNIYRVRNDSTNLRAFNRQMTRGSLRTGSQFDVFGVQDTKRALLNTLSKPGSTKKNNIFSKRTQNEDFEVNMFFYTLI